VLTDGSASGIFQQPRLLRRLHLTGSLAEEIQDQLLSAHVLVLGSAGSLGRRPAPGGLGVRRLTLVDFDTVDMRNVAGSSPTPPDQIGQPKVDHVARGCARSTRPSR